MCACASKPLIVPYIPWRNGGGRQPRHYYLACTYCDSTDLWPVFIKQSPKVSKEG